MTATHGEETDLSKVSQSQHKKNLLASQNKFDQAMKDREVEREERIERTAQLKALRLGKRPEDAQSETD